MSNRNQKFWQFPRRGQNCKPARLKSKNPSDSYYDDMANVNQLCVSWSILFRWEGSIYKILWRHVLIYFCLYIALGLIYKFGLSPPSQKSFETICLCCSKYADSIPVVLFLGFFTGTVMQRWWGVYSAIPGTGRIITLATCYMKRNQVEGSKWLRTLVRYILLSWMLAMRNVCRPMMKKYPTLESIRQAGFLLEHEEKILERICQEEGHSKVSLHVINWALLLVRQGREQDIFESASDCPRLLDPIVAFKKSCSMILKFKITAIPLSFVQAVALTVHAFGVVSLLGRQFYDHSHQPPQLVIDVYLPILPTMQYLAYLSWLKLAEVAVNPFGDDDDDFDLVELFNNHVQMAGDLLELFELGHNNPIKESLERTNETMFKVNEDSDYQAYKTMLNLPWMDESDSIELAVAQNN